MMRFRPAALLFIALSGSLVACEGGMPAASGDVPPTPTSGAGQLGEHVIAEWIVGSPAGIYIGSESVWVPGQGLAGTTRIDPVSNTVIEVVGAEIAEHAPIAEAFGSQWIASPDNKLDRVDPATHHVVAAIELEEGYQYIGNGVLVTDDGVWVAQSDEAELIRIDPATNKVASRTPWTTLIDEAEAHTAVPAGRGTDFLWLQIVGDEGGGITKGLLRLDPTSGAGLTFLPWSPDQSGDGAIAVTDTAVWYGAGRHIYRIDVATNQIDATYDTAPGTVHLGIGFGSVWLTNYERNLVQRLDVAL